MQWEQLTNNTWTLKPTCASDTNLHNEAGCAVWLPLLPFERAGVKADAPNQYAQRLTRDLRAAGWPRGVQVYMLWFDYDAGQVGFKFFSPSLKSSRGQLLQAIPKFSEETDVKPAEFEQLTFWPLPSP